MKMLDTQMRLNNNNNRSVRAPSCQLPFRPVGKESKELSDSLAEQSSSTRPLAEHSSVWVVRRLTDLSDSRPGW